MRIDIFMHNVHSIMELIFVQYRNSSGASGSSWYLWWVTTLLTTFFHTRCLGLFLLELKRHQEKLLKNTTTQSHPQRTITTFFSPITPTNATSQSSDTQMGSRQGHNKGVTIDRAMAICRARRPRPHGPQP